MIAFVTRILLPHAARARRQAGWAAQCKGRLLTPAIWANGCKSQVNAARFNADFCRKFRAEASDTLEQVQRKNKQLRVQLSKSPWPKLKFFSSKGQNYGLPLRAESRDLRCLPVGPVLAYLAGFFDGDGCVACLQNMSGCTLVIGQSFDQAEVLVLFYETFGGSITLHRGGLGLNKPSLAWRACGQSARAAAQLLMPHSITKQKQLLLAAEWPVARSHREECKAELRALKKYDSAVSGLCSWEYCAGFFDAEGCISQQRGGASLVLWLSQKHARVLKCLQEHFARSLGKDVTLAKSGGSAHVLLVSGLTSCKQILQQLLAAGLICKAEQAKLVVGLTKETAAQVNVELGCLTGNQKFGKRLDAAGQESARKIRLAQYQANSLRRCGQLAKARANQGEVESLKRKHELLKAIHENQHLVEYMLYVQSLHHHSWEGPSARDM